MVTPSILLCLSLLAISLSFTESQSFIGVNYGQVADNLPPPEATAKLLQSTTIGKIRIFGTDPGIIRALGNSGVGIVIGVGNGDIPSLASDPSAATQWVSANVLPYYPVSNITLITVGNEVLTSGDQGLISQLVPAIRNVQSAISSASLGGKIKVSTVHSMAVLTQSDPPSSGLFNPVLQDTLKQLLAFQRDNNSPLTINPYPFFAYQSDPRPETLAFCLFQPNSGRVDSGNGKLYTNMFDAQVYSLDWTSEKNRIVSASQDGRLIVWNALTSQKTHAIKLPCAWVMTCAFSPTGQSVACGGLDSICSIFNLNSPTDRDGNLTVSRMLTGHKGYVSSCQYVPDEDTHLITGSGDQTCILWDITTGLRTSVFGGEFQSGHTADVLSISINGSNSRMFVSGSCDATARLWDTRVASRAVRTFHGHEGDVNAVKFFPDGNRFGTGSDDGTCRLFDIRTGHQLQVYYQQHSDNDIAHVTSIAFSISGRLLFAGYTNGDCYVWDTLLAKVVLNLGSLQNSHEGKISCLGLSADGSALCTGSWDTNLKIWAFGGHRRVL
ncbi:guanine nucleotide-binding protein subunit beta-2 isoform X1 [Gastrolobium bilobum]|uniref:guanine nucleotide-binding protein subunit beta-2 isoform X1 n=1 Tax=Gastrolobium bilobum TaxID=150636 RepID=UPI002AB23B74|nr:guanine nucleotide-binding protein subunit beta-2 isoform X1 [Gastrolobium bilobum]